jgi:hypothetical protein
VSDDAFGTDLDTFVGGVPGMDPNFGMVAGPPAVVQAIARMLMDPIEGYDLTDLAGVQMTNLRRARIVDAVEQVLGRDDRVKVAKVQSLVQATPGRWVMTVRVDLGSGPFDLVLGISQVTVEILKIGSANG